MNSKLNLSSYSVEELSLSELNETNGGCLLAIGIGVIVGLAVASYAVNKSIKINNKLV
ncbi:MAG: hypothetical protein LBG80_19315 [Bacteroidales bacterium]|jgi:uncharacterized membrane protein (Fun14 family)|nr:hypothetical protein [Bacteroidales bacterium]